MRFLSLKSRESSQLLYETLGRERAGELLRTLLRRHHGRSYTVADFAAAGAQADAPSLDDWFYSTALPGFLVAPAEVFRLADSAAGEPRYQALVHVRNDEPAAGWFRFGPTYVFFAPGGTAPFRVDANAAIEVGIVMDEPPDQLWLHPFLALHQRSIQVSLPNDVNPDERRSETAFSGSRPSSWAPKSVGIVVDDLDDGFAAQTRDTMTGRLGRLLDRGDEPEELGHGWTRRLIPSGWGKYDRTVTLAPAGDGRRQAVFSVQLPNPGRWRLEYHVPDRELAASSGVRGQTFFEPLGRLNLRLRLDGVVAHEVEFDGTAAEVGWNKVGEFDLAGRDVDLIVSDRTTGSTVVADAIRWMPIDPPVADG